MLKNPTLWFMLAAIVPERKVGPRLSVIAANLRINVAKLGKKRNLENNSKSPYYEDAKAEALGTVCQHWNCVLEF